MSIICSTYNSIYNFTCSQLRYNNLTFKLIKSLTIYPQLTYFTLVGSLYNPRISKLEFYMLYVQLVSVYHDYFHTCDSTN